MEKSYSFKESEDNIYKKWEESGFFNPDNLGLGDDAEKYSIVLPPPNVTGTLHMGHAGVLTFEDILIRYNRMKGKKALWVPGTDHAAIATQTKVEKIIKEEGETRHTLGKEKFLERVHQFASDSHDTIVGQCKKMGASLDWSREAYTLDKTREKAVNSVFKLMYDDGLIYRGERIVNWCPRCHSTLADDEVEYKESKSKLYFFKYSKDLPIVIATTRPETKLGDTAIAVNPRDKRFKDIIGKEYKVNFVGVDLKLKIIADRNVEMEFGAGALGVTPAHSAVDWKMAEENNLEIIKVIDEDGLIHEGFGDYSGKTVKEARRMVVEKLTEAGLLEKEEEIDNNLSLCYRCDTLIEPLPSLQWFINVNKKVVRLGGKSLKETSIAAATEGVYGREKINFIPSRFENIYLRWMENLNDWCISRQILFGHQVPVWYRGEDRAEIFVGLEAPEGDGWERDSDTLDTWFSSGMWTFSTMAHSPDDIRIENGGLVIDTPDFRNYHPTSVLETAYDIIFFWVARMIIMTTYAINDIPFQDVYLQGLVLDAKGKKMSKSKNNSINPLDMIDKYGTDATRLSLIMGTTPGNDMRMSEEKIESYRNLINKIWNVARYILQSTDSTITNFDLDHEKLTVADRWILSEITELTKDNTKRLDEYKFAEAGEALREFTWNILADWYVEATKFQKGSETEKTLLYVLRELLKLWHPFIPFVSESIWQEFNQKYLMVEPWTREEKLLNIKKEGANFNILKDIIHAIRNVRAENKVEPSKKVKTLIIAPNKSNFIKKNEALIKGMRTGVDVLEVNESAAKPEKAIFAAVSDIEIYLIGAIDEEKEKIRLEKAILNLDGMIQRIESKLNNKDFADKAPKEILEREKNSLEEYQGEKKKLEEQLKNL